MTAASFYLESTEENVKTCPVDKKQCLDGDEGVCGDCAVAMETIRCPSAETTTPEIPIAFAHFGGSGGDDTDYFAERGEN